MSNLVETNLIYYQSYMGCTPSSFLQHLV